MRLLITGTSGFVGKHLLKALEKRDCQITALERNSWKPMQSNIDVVHWPEGSDIPVIDEPGFDALIHLAWDTASRHDWSIQLDQVDRLNQLCRLLPHIRKVVCLGSSEEYGPASGVLHESATPELPLSPYGWSKLSGCQLIQSRAASHKIPVVWFRAFTIYGEIQTGDMLIPYAIKQAQNKSTARFTDGLQERDFIHVSDVADAIEMAVAADIESNHIVNLGTGIGTTVKELIERIGQHYDALKYMELGAIPRNPELPMQQVAATNLANELLGFSAATSLEDGLAKTLALS